MLGSPSPVIRPAPRATTNWIERPHSVVPRIRGRATCYQDAYTVMRWSAMGFLEGEQSFRRIRGCAHIKALIATLRTTGNPVQSVVESACPPALTCH